MSRTIDADALWMDVIHSMEYCDDILEIIERQPTVPQWVSVKDDLPDERKPVLFFTVVKTYHIGYYCTDQFSDPFWRVIDAFHVIPAKHVLAWYPLLEPYQPEEKQ